MSHFIFSEELCFAAFIDLNIVLMIPKLNIKRFLLIHTSDFKTGYPIDDTLEITNHNYKVFNYDNNESFVKQTFSVYPPNIIHTHGSFYLINHLHILNL